MIIMNTSMKMKIYNLFIRALYYFHLSKFDTFSISLNI